MNRLTWIFAATLLACAEKPKPAAPAPVANTEPAIKSVSPHVGVTKELASSCNIKFGEVENAPKFEFDKSELGGADRDILQQIATCVTTGPLKGRALRLVGHADPRGEHEYNMTLGGHRSGAARSFLTQLGVDPAKLEVTSRGELDAAGKDEEGWTRDRRVDVLLR